MISLLRNPPKSKPPEEIVDEKSEPKPQPAPGKPKHPEGQFPKPMVRPRKKDKPKLTHHSTTQVFKNNFFLKKERSISLINSPNSAPNVLEILRPSLFSRYLEKIRRKFNQKWTPGAIRLIDFPSLTVFANNYTMFFRALYLSSSLWGQDHRDLQAK